MNKINNLDNKKIFEICNRVLGDGKHSIFKKNKFGNQCNDFQTEDKGDELLGWFCRGCSKTSYRMIPSVFREGHCDEHELYTEVLRTHLDKEFNGLSDLEILCKMQHYGVPTRLLDLTLSPLVAAFFALDLLESNATVTIDKKDRPKIVAVPVNKSQYAEFYSDRVSVLSSIPRLTIEEQNSLLIDSINDLAIQTFVKNQGINSDLQRREYCNLIRFATYKFTSLINASDIGKLFESANKNDIQDAILGELNKEINYFCSHNNSIYKLKNFSYFPVLFEIITTNDNIGYYTFFSFQLNKNVHNEGSFEFMKSDNETKMNRKISIVVPKYNEKDNVNCFVLFDIEDCNLNNFEILPMLSFNDVYVSPIMEKLYKFVARKNLNIFRNTNPSDLINGVYVIPPETNDRVKAQQGVFALFGLSRYWNIFKAVKFFQKKYINYNAILNFVLRNKGFVLFDDKKGQTKNWYDLGESELDFLEKEVFGIEQKIFNNNVDLKLQSYIENLSISGINKKTLGCSLLTTSKNFQAQCKKL